MSILQRSGGSSTKSKRMHEIRKPTGEPTPESTRLPRTYPESGSDTAAATGIGATSAAASDTAAAATGMGIDAASDTAAAAAATGMGVDAATGMGIDAASDTAAATGIGATSASGSDTAATGIGVDATTDTDDFLPKKIPNFDMYLKQLLEALTIDRATQEDLKNRFKPFDDDNKYTFIKQTQEHLDQLIEIDRLILDFTEKYPELELDELKNQLTELQFLSLLIKKK